MRTKVFAIVLINLAIACVPGAQRDVKFQQYYAEGELLYQQHCANCHQTDGSGLGRVYPPLAKSDFMITNPDAVLCLMKYGIEGEMIVNGVTYNKAMPGIANLTDLEIAEIATYIHNSWGNTREMMEVNQVTPILATCPPVQ
ncbi:MAG TPA: cytochrome C [Cytophagales bacterium]|nr:cytochrome C [Cytophagales bacterium]HRG07458.1 cytochrome c [Cyclobacteriaceae bacterium]